MSGPHLTTWSRDTNDITGITDYERCVLLTTDGSVFNFFLQNISNIVRGAIKKDSKVKTLAELF